MKTSVVTIERAPRGCMKWVYASKDDGAAVRRIDRVVVYENGAVLTSFDGCNMYDNMRNSGPITINTPAKWNTRAEADLTAAYAHLVKAASNVWDEPAYDLYIPNEYAGAYVEKRARSRYYMQTTYAAPGLGRTTKWTPFPGFEPYKLQSILEEASKYHYTGLDIATPAGREWAASLIESINGAIDDAARITAMTDKEFFDACKEA